MRVLLHQVDAAAPVDVALDVDEAGVQLGRGPQLRIDATNISRKHVILSVKGGKLHLLCLHR